MCDYVQRGDVKFEYVTTNEQVLDILMNSMPHGKHVYLRDKMGMVKITFLSKREF